MATSPVRRATLLLLVALPLLPPQPDRLVGRVTRSDTGGPVDRALIQLIAARSGEATHATTDEFGQFEFTGLDAGDYRARVIAPDLVSVDATVASPSGIERRIRLAEGQPHERVDFVMAPLSAIEGHVLDAARLPLAGVTVELARMRRTADKGMLIMPMGTERRTGRTDDAGHYRIAGLRPGDYYVFATTGPLGVVPTDGPTPGDNAMGYVRTYFPGTDRATLAQPIRVEVSRSAFDVTFALRAEKMARLSGIVSDEAGRPVADARVMLIRTEDGGISTEDTATATSDAGGAFTYDAVPAGTFQIQALATGAFGSTPISISGLEPAVNGVAVTVRTLVSARGQLSFGGAPPPPKDLVRLRFVPTDFVSGPAGGSRTATMDDDWTFEINQLAWTGCLRVLAPAGWALKSVLRDGRDVTDVPSDFQSADVNGLEVVMTSRLASIAGSVTDGNQPATFAWVVVFGEEPATGGCPSRFDSVTRVTSEGEFKADDLLPARYRVIAVTAEAIADLDWLATARNLAMPVAVTEGELRTVSLRLIGR